VRKQKADAIIEILAKLSVLYWRPDHSEAQFREMYSQYLDALEPFAFRDITVAVEKWRNDGANKFFPTPGELRSLIVTPPSWWVSGKNEWMADLLNDAAAEITAALATGTNPLLPVAK